MPRTPRRFRVGDHDLACPVCGCDRFWLSWTLLNTAGMSFLGVDWANNQAQTLTCKDCTHIVRFGSDVAEMLDD